jgi:hypothetical protein
MDAGYAEPACKKRQVLRCARHNQVRSAQDDASMVEWVEI